jgi:glycoprotein 3-alpha-L-fucosyltransferase
MDYVTEKFFNPLSSGMVPIYYGGHGLEHIAPQYSFINVLNYSSIAKLAAQLLYLDQNDDEYQRYFEWTQQYKVGYPRDWCELCKKLHTVRPGDPPHSYKDLHSWWNEKDERGNPICLENVGYVDRWNAFWDYVL